MSDQINPPHYRRSIDALGVEVIDILEYFFPDDPLMWQVGKYLLRAGHKDDLVQELKKARWYLERRIRQEQDDE